MAYGEWRMADGEWILAAVPTAQWLPCILNIELSFTRRFVYLLMMHTFSVSFLSMDILFRLVLNI
jgi:hypothetical protein